ncbi:MAG: DUF2189 domain-containing protein, partial [Altererythrobacter sp.]|nr:DUF2189 domain-containing protein [Altererythrobacter sp.]
MTNANAASAGLPAVATDLSLRDVRAALNAGWADFRACPAYGVVFALIFVVSGLGLAFALIERGEIFWLILAAAGFPLLAPFTAVGLYEVSRRRENGLPIDWGNVLGALKGRGDEQILSMGLLLFVAFGFWIIIAHTVFSIFVVEAGAGSESLAFLLTQTGLIMLAVGSIIGAIIALVFYIATVMSLPMLVDRKVSFVAAIITSISAFRANTLVLLCWA